jgi:nucleoside triphosphate diphosphatase
VTSYLPGKDFTAKESYLRRPSLPENEYLKHFARLVDIIARLRAPDGCPWDRKQTHASLREGLLEECYEVLAAIDENAPEKLREELGDLLLHIVFQAQIASQDGEFDLADVLVDINRKLIRRHPHIFGDGQAADADAVARGWEQLKKAERGEDANSLESVPLAMPSLSYSASVQGRVARLGFDWDEDDGVLEKLVEEVGEFSRATDQAEREDEFGDILFTLVNFGRRGGIDAESALRAANQKFYRRFTCMEKLCRERGAEFEKMPFAAKNELWEEAKRLC